MPRWKNEGNGPRQLVCLIHTGPYKGPVLRVEVGGWGSVTSTHLAVQQPLVDFHAIFPPEQMKQTEI